MANNAYHAGGGAVMSVGQLTRSVKSLLEGNFPFVWVRGQVTNCSRASSGHIYFSLKDEDAALSAVWFKGQQRETENFDPLTGEVFEDGPKPGLAAGLHNGQELVCAGRLSVYPPRGAYQLVVELAQDAGTGRLHLEFERLKTALAAQGYFAQARKRPLPPNPVRVAVVTAATGAALRDFLRMAHERGVGGEIRIYPTLVQGDEAPARIAAAVRRVMRDGWAEVLCLIRGGGSLEDLWAFNTELVATALFEANIPVVAGIGHEVDTSIADLVADVRAATPTHAAQLIWLERRERMQAVDETELRLGTVWQRGLARREDRLAGLDRAIHWLSPLRSVTRWQERFTRCSERLQRAGAALHARPEQRLDALLARLAQTPEQALAVREHSCERLGLRLAGLDPMGPLERGYALARTDGGAFVRSVQDVGPGQRLALLLRDGELPVRVEE